MHLAVNQTNLFTVTIGNDYSSIGEFHCKKADLPGTQAYLNFRFVYASGVVYNYLLDAYKNHKNFNLTINLYTPKADVLNNFIFKNTRVVRLEPDVLSWDIRDQNLEFSVTILNTY